MRDIQPTGLTTKELLRYADLALLQGKPLPIEWQQEIIDRFDRELNPPGFDLKKPRR